MVTNINTVLQQRQALILFQLTDFTEFDVCLSVRRCMCIEKKDQLDATEWFINPLNTELNPICQYYK